MESPHVAEMLQVFDDQRVEFRVGAAQQVVLLEGENLIDLSTLVLGDLERVGR